MTAPFVGSAISRCRVWNRVRRSVESDMAGWADAGAVVVEVVAVVEVAVTVDGAATCSGSAPQALRRVPAAITAHMREKVMPVILSRKLSVRLPRHQNQWLLRRTQGLSGFDGGVIVVGARHPRPAVAVRGPAAVPDGAIPHRGVGDRGLRGHHRGVVPGTFEGDGHMSGRRGHGEHGFLLEMTVERHPAGLGRVRVDLLVGDRTFRAAGHQQPWNG